MTDTACPFCGHTFDPDAPRLTAIQVVTCDALADDQWFLVGPYAPAPSERAVLAGRVAVQVVTADDAVVIACPAPWRPPADAHYEIIRRSEE